MMDDAGPREGEAILSSFLETELLDSVALPVA
jgi:hypothetical protein